jgi:hypothetical protein
MKLPVRQRLRIHLDTGRSIEGVLLSRRGPWLKLAESRVESKGELVDSPEPVVVPLARIEFVQVVG